MHICEYLHKNLHFCGAFSSGSAGGVFPKRDVLTPKFSDEVADVSQQARHKRGTEK